MTSGSEHKSFSKVDASDDDDPIDYLRAFARYLRGEMDRHNAAKKDIEIILERISELLGLPQPNPTPISGPTSGTEATPQSTLGKAQAAGQQSTPATSAPKDAMKGELRSNEGLLL